MPFVLNRVERGRYLDSVALMRLSRRLSALPGIEEAALMIGSPSNKALLREAGRGAGEGAPAGGNHRRGGVGAPGERRGSARKKLRKPSTWTSSGWPTREERLWMQYVQS